MLSASAAHNYFIEMVGGGGVGGNFKSFLTKTDDFMKYVALYITIVISLIFKTTV